METDYPTTSKPSIKVCKNAKGAYTWEIKIYADFLEPLPSFIEDIDADLKSRFKNEDQS